MNPLQLRDIWGREIAKNDGVARIECQSWMSRATLDIIGLAGKLLYPTCHHHVFLKLKSLGFNYKFNALSGDPERNELMNSFSTLIKAGQSISVIPSLRALYPALRFLVRIGIVTSLFHPLIFTLDYSRHQTTLQGPRLLL